MNAAAEHYVEAERIMRRYAALGPASQVEYGPSMLAEAQIHATLANVSANVERLAQEWPGNDLPAEDES